MGLNVIFIAGFAGTGLLVSLFAGFYVGNRITYISFVSLLSSLSFAVLGFGVYKILEIKVPEFLSYLSGLSGALATGSGGYSEEGDPSGMGMGGNLDEMEGGDVSDSLDTGPSVSLSDSGKSGKFGDHIMVDKIAIKNEPKLMAEAIRTMMSKDDENS